MEQNGTQNQLPLIQVAAGILWKEDRFLAQLRKKKGLQGGFWEFPGGKLEQDESAEDALARELREELGIVVKEANLWQTIEHSYAKEGFRVRLFFFHIARYEGSPRGLEGQTLRWMTVAEALMLNFLPADVAILARLGSLRLMDPNL